MPIPDSFSVVDTDTEKAVSTTKSQIPKYDPTLFDDNSKLSNTDFGIFFLERENMLAIANTGLFIIHYDESLEIVSYNIRINFSSSVNDLISIFNISSKTPKKFIKVIQTGKNLKNGLTYITLTDSSLTNVNFKRNGVTAPTPNTLQILYQSLISGFLVYVEDGKFVFDFQTFYVNFPPIP